MTWKVREFNCRRPVGTLTNVFQSIDWFDCNVQYSTLRNSDLRDKRVKRKGTINNLNSLVPRPWLHVFVYSMQVTLSQPVCVGDVLNVSFAWTQARVTMSRLRSFCRICCKYLMRFCFRLMHHATFSLSSSSSHLLARYQLSTCLELMQVRSVARNSRDCYSRYYCKGWNRRMHLLPYS